MGAVWVSRPVSTPVRMSGQRGTAMSETLWPRVAPILLLLASNLFMTFAWYGHLKHKGTAIWLAIGVSWLIALPE